MKRKVLTLQLTFICLLCFFFSPAKIEAKSIFDLPLTTIPKSTTEIKAEYSFIAKFINGKTTTEVFGNNWKKTKIYSSDTNAGNDWWSFNPGSSNSGKGKTGIIYKNIGRYNGKEIDLKITINDWDRYSDTSGNISYSSKGISHITQGYNWVDQTWSYLESGTNIPVEISGYMTIADIDARQGIRFSKETSSKIDNLFVPSTNNWVQFDNVNGEYYFYDETNTLSGTYDEHAQFTFLYLGAKELRFKWVREFDKTRSKPSMSINTNQAGGEMFTYLSTKPAKTEILKPDKEIMVDQKTETTSSIITNVKENIKYAVYHQVPSESEKYYYNNYVVTDTLSSLLTSVEVKIMNERGEDETSKFNINTNNNKITATAKNTKDKNFYDKTYKFVYTAAINLEKAKSNVINNIVNIDNTATVNVDGTTKTTNSVKSKLYQRNLTINHIDKLTGEVIEKETVKLFDGENYSYAPKNNLKYLNKYSYTPIDKNKVEGIINGKDVVENIYYTRPNSDVSINKIQIFTDKAESGLPVKLSFIVNPLNSEWKKDKVVLSIYEKESRKKIISTETSVEQLEKGLELKIPPNNLSVNSEKNYEAVIEQADPIKVVVIEDRVDTLGYTASEKMLEQQAETNSKIEYKGVVMTEREVGKKIETYYETITLPLQKNKPIKSGYGLQMNQKIRYQNDIGINNVETSKLAVYLDSKIVDGDFYREENGKVKIELENEEVFENDTLVQTLKYPKVFIEEVDGTVFSEQQVNEQHESINHNVVDGGNKVYVPIWIESLGEYKYQLKNEEPIGINEINVIVNDTINVEAYMYGHIGSETIENDEILIVPVDLVNPFPNGLPVGWTESDLEWLQGN